MKKTISLYLLCLIMLSVLLFYIKVPQPMFLEMKFLFPKRIFFLFITIFIISLENILFLENIRQALIMKDALIIRLKRQGFKRFMIRLLMKMTVVYLCIQILWCLFIIHYLPILLLCFDFLKRVLLTRLMIRYHECPFIYLILLIGALFTQYLFSFIFQ